MTEPRAARSRNVLWTIHRWIGVGLGVLLMPIAVSGALLVFQDDIDAVIHPNRYAVSGVEAAQPLSAYLANATAALEPGLAPSIIRLPRDGGSPVTVVARGTRGEGGPPRAMTVFLDPPTARVLDVVDTRASFTGLLHRFHENLTIPQFSGRQIVGWVGTGMLILSLSGIFLWWPRNGAFVPGLRWRRSPAVTTNLHHLFGFWISVPLAAVSLSGIYLAFPPQARSLMGTIAAVNPQPQRFGFGPVMRQPALTPDAALKEALGTEPDARPLEMILPTAVRDGGSGQNAGPPPFWRIQLRKSDGATATILVNDRTGEIAAAPEMPSGDRVAQWIRWIHEGSHSGAIWRAIVFLTGLFPAVLGVTGITMWLRGRKARKAAKFSRAADGAMQAAE